MEKSACQYHGMPRLSLGVKAMHHLQHAAGLLRAQVCARC